MNQQVRENRIKKLIFRKKNKFISIIIVFRVSLCIGHDTLINEGSLEITPTAYRPFKIKHLNIFIYTVRPINIFIYTVRPIKLRSMELEAEHIIFLLNIFLPYSL